MKWINHESVPKECYSLLDSFINTSIYHEPEWHNFLLNVFGWKTRSLVLCNDVGEVHAWIPYVIKKRMQFIGSSCVSLPLSHHIDVARRDGDNGVLPTIDIPLEIHALLKGEGVVSISDKHVTKLHLGGFETAEQLFGSFHKTAVKQMVNKANREGFVVSTAFSSKAIDDYVALENQTRHRQGAPTYPASFFNEMALALLSGGKMKCFFVYRGEKMVAGSIFLYHKETAIHGYSACHRDKFFMRQGVNQLSLWAGIKDAFERGYKVVDFGSTAHSLDNLRKYKERWGGISEPLHVSFTGGLSAKDAVKRDSSSVQFVSKVLKKMPLGLFNIVSPHLLKRVV